VNSLSRRAARNDLFTFPSGPVLGSAWATVAPTQTQAAPCSNEPRLRHVGSKLVRSSWSQVGPQSTAIRLNLVRPSLAQAVLSLGASRPVFNPPPQLTYSSTSKSYLRPVQFGCPLPAWSLSYAGRACREATCNMRQYIESNHKRMLTDYWTIEGMVKDTQTKLAKNWMTTFGLWP
jgi:hypothetical protein